MPNLAQITLAGHLGGDAETKFTSGGKAVTKFSVAVNTNPKDREAKPTWFACSMWGERGEKIAQYLTRGTGVFVIGRFTARTYESNGTERLSLDVDVNEIQFMQKGDTEPRQQEPARRQAPASDTGFGVTADDVPFMRYDVPCL